MSELPYPSEYIGDGVYVHFDGYQIWLITLEGNQIAINDRVYPQLLDFAEKQDWAWKKGEEEE